MKLTPAALAGLCNVDRRTVTNWLNETPPLPSRMKGRSREIDSVDAMRWLQDRAARKAIEAAAATDPADEDKERARKLRLEADLKEIELAERRGQVVPVTEYQEQLDDFVGGLAAVAAGRLQRFERDIVFASTPADARRVTRQIHAALMEGARDYAEQLDAEAAAIEAAEPSPAPVPAAS